MCPCPLSPLLVVWLAPLCAPDHLHTEHAHIRWQVLVDCVCVAGALGVGVVGLVVHQDAQPDHGAQRVNALVSPAATADISGGSSCFRGMQTSSDGYFQDQHDRRTSRNSQNKNGQS